MERDKDGERRQGEETVVVLRRFRGRVSHLGVIIDTAGGGGWGGGGEGGNGKRGHGRPAHLSDELLLIVMATQF